MKLTILRRLKICWEVLTYTSGHAPPAQEKGLPIFLRGYAAGYKDAPQKDMNDVAPAYTVPKVVPIRRLRAAQDRIEALEAALKYLDPNHPLLGDYGD